MKIDSSQLDEAPVTGQSTPVAKLQCASAYAGSVITNGELRVEVRRTAPDIPGKAVTARLMNGFASVG
ncbi:P-type ATPase [Caballeronia glathei]|uniref:P-type ATPase n=1 Tax=Caballeronia glathei TaxID=60547 RepID=UPI0009DD05E3|nr:hypothetical protein [Caballeronia glathei]